MKILVVGGGGREHALVWRLARSGHEIIAAPGNPGIARDATCLPIAASDLDGIEKAAMDNAVELVVVGPEAPLVAGLADRLRVRGVAVFGPSAEAAQLEGSKIYSKEFFARHNIRSAEFVACSSVEEADAAIERLGGDVVVKADGLAAGKGVVVCDSQEQARAAARRILVDRAFGAAGERLVVERKLPGQELSVMAITDGTRYAVLAQAEDHKAIFDGDLGPNTGGMGTVSPAPWATAELLERVEREILEPTMRGLATDGIDYRGVLYAGIMVDAEGVPWLLEYNCRFGDPETQPVMARFASDPARWLAGAAAGELPGDSIEWDDRTAVCVVMAAEGYPGAPVKGDVIEGVAALEAGSQNDDVVVFQAGTVRRADQLLTNGGRVLGVTALDVDLASARARAYSAVQQIQFRGSQIRTDIGARGE